MVSVPLFKDLEKAPKDLLGKDYDTQNSLKIKAKACDNKITTEIGSSSTKLTCEMPPVGGATMQKFSVSTKDDLSYEMEADNMLVDGLMVKFSTAETVGKGFQGPDKLTFDYQQKNDQYSAHAVVAASPSDIVTYDLSGVGAFEGGLFGLQLLGSKDKPLSGANAALGYSTSDLSVVMKTNKMFTGANVFGQYKLDGSTTLAMKVAGKLDGSSAPDCTVGGKWKMDSSTSLAFKMCTGNKLGLSLSQKLQPNLDVITAAEIPMSGSVKIGAAFTLSN
jgi:hypothetical protein